ncbi:MAG: MBL fold metallo-hydrolase, partial [Rhodospirillaceae bacterium]
MTLDIRQIPVLNDNYVYLVREPKSGCVGVVDPAVVAPVLDEAKSLGWTITHILNTHHHGDHTGGNLEIKEVTGCAIVGPGPDRDRIPGIEVEVTDGDTFTLGDEDASVFFVPGHTRGHIAYWFADSDALFCGDTLFSVGETQSRGAFSSGTLTLTVHTGLKVTAGTSYKFSFVVTNPDSAQTAPTVNIAASGSGT